MIIKVDSNANMNIGKVCVCGILIMPSQSITIGSNSHLLWRGLIIWDMKQPGKELQLNGNNDSTFVIDGGMLMAGTVGMQIRVNKSVTNPVATVDKSKVTGTAKQLYRYNPQAVIDAFTAVPLPVRAIRRVR